MQVETFTEILGLTREFVSNHSTDSVLGSIAAGTAALLLAIGGLLRSGGKLKRLSARVAKAEASLELLKQQEGRRLLIETKGWPSARPGETSESSRRGN
jgi:hypothetical protein